MPATSLPSITDLLHLPLWGACYHHYSKQGPHQSTDLPNPSPNLQARGNTNLGHLAPMELQLGVAQLLSLTRWTHLTVLIAQHGPGALAAPQTPAQ